MSSYYIGRKEWQIVSTFFKLVSRELSDKLPFQKVPPYILGNAVPVGQIYERKQKACERIENLAFDEHFFGF